MAKQSSPQELSEFGLGKLNEYLPQVLLDADVMDGPFIKTLFFAIGAMIVKAREEAHSHRVGA